MTLYGADLFLNDIQQQRLVTITGHNGCGKTNLAFEMAMYYLRRGYKLISNIDNVWQDENMLERLQEPGYIKHSVIIMEEAGHHMRKWEYFEPLVLYKRKFDTFIFLPSARLPHENLSEFVAKPLPWLQRLMPINLNYWTYVQGSGDQDFLGSFWVSQGVSTGVYDTHDVSYAPDEIVDAFRRQIDWDNQQKGRSDKFSGVGSSNDLDAEAALLARAAKNTRRLLSLYKSKRGK